MKKVFADFDYTQMEFRVVAHMLHRPVWYLRLKYRLSSVLRRVFRFLHIPWPTT